MRSQRPAFEKARRGEAYKKFSRAVKKERETQLLPLDEVTSRLGIFEQTYVGIQPVPVLSIVGSADQNRDFDRDFRPLREDVRERWEEVERAFPAGDFPPIVVYQVGSSYFVVDGHHRVSVARHKRVQMIDAEITRLHSRYDLPPSADIGSLILSELERLFMDRSGLQRARPDARIPLSRAHGYLELLELVEVHGYRLTLQRERVVPPEEAAADWYERVYLPTVDVIKREGLLDLSPEPEGDHFLWVYQRHRTLFPERRDVTLEQTAREAGAEARERRDRKPRLKPPRDSRRE